MRLVLAALLLALVSCGPAAKPGVKPPAVTVEVPLPPAYDVVKAPMINGFAVDATHVYWSSNDGLYRRALGPDQPAQRLFASEHTAMLAVGTTELFFDDQDGALRAIPLAGGTPRTIASDLENMPWALFADGDTAWYVEGETLYGESPSGRKAIPIGAVEPYFAAGGGAAYFLSYSDEGTYQIARYDLETGNRQVVSTAGFLADTTGLAVMGDELLVAISDGAVAVPIDGGKPHRAFYGVASAVAADAAGYAIGGYGYVASHARNQPPHLLAAATYADTLIANNALALSADYVYYTSSTTDGELVLRATPRAGGDTMLRLPLSSSLTAVGASTGAVFAGIETEIGTALFQVGTRKAKVVAPSGWIETIAADDTHVVVYAESTLFGTDRTGNELSSITEVSYTPTLALHKGKVYWGEGPMIRAASLPAGEAFQVVDTSAFDPSFADLSIGGLAFASDHLFFAVNYGERLGIAQVDEQRQIAWLWTWTPDDDAYTTLDSSVVAVGDQLFIHDGTYVYQVALDGTSKRVFSGLPRRDDEVATSVSQLYAAGDHLIARVYRDSDALIEIPVDGGKPKTIWETSLDGGGLSYFAVAPDAVYIHVAELESIVKVAL